MPYLGHDQHGNHYAIKEYPRKELMEQLGRSHVAKMYTDRGGEKPGVYHIGYIIAGCWISVYGLEGLTFATLEG